MNHLPPATVLEIPIEHRKEQPSGISYEIFGQPLHTAPIVLVNHALTGNSKVAGPDGWWKELVGEGKTIDLNAYTVIGFNIPGNAYPREINNFNINYKAFTTHSIAKLFWVALDALHITKLYAIIGGSLGGAIAWEMAILRPKAMDHLIPIATNLQASDWLIGNVLVQDALLNQKENPVENARMHAMLLYRTPESLAQKFNKSYVESENQYAVESWLKYHGSTLRNRYPLQAYKQMNYLLRTIGAGITDEAIRNFALESTITIHCIAIDSDYLFTLKEQKNTFRKIKKLKATIYFHEIKSIHGHDAFLIEYEQLNNLLKNLF